MKRISRGKKFRACLFDGINKKRLFQSKMHKLKKENGFRKIIIQTDIKLHQMNIKPRYNQEDWEASVCLRENAKFSNDEYKMIHIFIYIYIIYLPFVYTRNISSFYLL